MNKCIECGSTMNFGYFVCPSCGYDHYLYINYEKQLIREEIIREEEIKKNNELLLQKILQTEGYKSINQYITFLNTQIIKLKNIYMIFTYISLNCILKLLDVFLDEVWSIYIPVLSGVYVIYILLIYNKRVSSVKEKTRKLFLEKLNKITPNQFIAGEKFDDNATLRTLSAREKLYFENISFLKLFPKYMNESEFDFMNFY
jgi:hypothetical protein